MQELISKTREFQNLQQVIKSWCVQISIQQPKIISYSLGKVSKLYDNYLEKCCLNQTFLTQKENIFRPVWYENELILFQWAVIIYSLLHQIHLKDFSVSEIEFFSSIFGHKEFYIVDYEIKCMLVKGKQLRNSWKIQEQNLLSSIITEIPEKNKWNQAARLLYKISGGIYFRQGKHCRQRWLSFIKNSKTQKKQNPLQDIKLLQSVSYLGENRTQIENNFTISKSKTSLRNRFNLQNEDEKAKSKRGVSKKQGFQSSIQKNNFQFQKGKNQQILKGQNCFLFKRKGSDSQISIEENVKGRNQTQNKISFEIQHLTNNFTYQGQYETVPNLQLSDIKHNYSSDGFKWQNQFIFCGSQQNFRKPFYQQHFPVQFYLDNQASNDQNFAQNFNWQPLYASYLTGNQLFFY